MSKKNQVVSIYLNDNNEIILIPTKCDGGPHFEALPFIKMEMDNMSDVGDTIKKLFLLIKEAKITLPEKGERVFQLATNIKTFSAFTKKHLCVNVVQFEDSGEYNISNNPRLKKGGYGVIDEETKKFAIIYSLPHTTSSEELGSAVKKAFSDGRGYVEFLKSK